MTGRLQDAARAVRTLATIGACAVVALVAVAGTTVPTWCDASPRESVTVCATTGGVDQ